MNKILFINVFIIHFLIISCDFESGIFGIKNNGKRSEKIDKNSNKEKSDLEDKLEEKADDKSDDNEISSSEVEIESVPSPIGDDSFKFVLDVSLFSGSTNDQTELFVFPLSSWPKSELGGAGTQSFIYMPIILTAMKAAGYEDSRHLDSSYISKANEDWTKAVPGFFELIRNIITYNLLKVETNKSSILENGNFLLESNNQTLVFDNTNHLRGTDQEIFLERYLNLQIGHSVIDIGDFLARYPISSESLERDFRVICDASGRDDELEDFAQAYYYNVLNDLITKIRTR